MLLTLLACVGSSVADRAPVAPLPLAEMRARPVVYTRHARCRMDCRHIDEQEVAAVLATGRHDPSRTRKGPCTSHALEGPDSDGGPLRIVFAACAKETKVVTVIDLDDSFPCDCR